jgi:hypothetical protein
MAGHVMGDGRVAHSTRNQSQRHIKRDETAVFASSSFAILLCGRLVVAFNLCSRLGLVWTFQVVLFLVGFCSLCSLFP